MSVAEVSSVYSNAFNFNEFLAGGVDPRTGVYTCSLIVGEIKSANLNGPSFPISLSYNPLTSADLGWGVGWSMSLVRYDVANELLTLSSGESYKARETATGLVFPELKLETVKVEKTARGRFAVIHKSGLREELEVFGSSDVAVPMRIVAANGIAIFFDYTAIDGQPVLRAVRDTQRTLLTVARNPGQVTLTQYPGTDREARFVLVLSNDEVSSIALPTGGAWYLTYERVGNLRCVTQVDSPLGAREFIGYQEVGHQFPPGSPLRSMAYVISHTVYPRQNQPAITKSYEYSQTNFLGFDDDDIRWSPEGDTLYQSSSDYRYTSTESLMAGARVQSSTVRTYNKYHLLLSQATTCNQSVTSESTEYYVDPNKSFQAQPAQFRLPKVQTLRYENRQNKTFREEVTRTEFDAMGNRLKHVGPDGVTTLSQFYPAAGGDGCPADPLGFVRFEKQRTVIAANAAGAASSIVVRYRHALHPALSSAALPTVLHVEEKLYELSASGEHLHSTTAQVYFDKPDEPLLHGQLQQQTVTRNGKATVSEFSCVLKGDELELQTTLHGFDGTSRTSRQTLSAFNGLKLSEQNEEGGAIAYEYDALGRTLSQTLSPDTPNAATRRTVYQLASRGQPASMLTTDLVGVAQRVIYDGLGRVVRVDEQDIDNPDETARTQMRTIFEARHDALGRRVEQTHIDSWDGAARPMTIGYVFDDWGQVKTTLYADGRQEHRDFDPVTRTETQWLQGMGKSVSRFNDFGKPDTVEAFNLMGESMGKVVHQYDGVGRAVSQTDPVGNTTTYQYDVLNRLCRSVLPDGQVVETEYAHHSQEPLATEVRVGELSLGRQTFDGLGRLVESTVGGRTVSAGYEAGFGQPVWEQSASGERVDFVYARDFGNRLLQRKARGLLASFTYSPAHGQPSGCIEQDEETRFEYYPSGRLKHEISIHAGQQRKASHTYSFGGRPLTVVDVLGNEHRTTYDNQGRATSFEQGALKAELVYSALGLLERVESHDTQDQRSIITHLTYDDLGRELSRRFELAGGVTQTLASTYTLAGKLARKVLNAGYEVLRDERFTYDCRGRLTDYLCDGSQLPRDTYGKPIIGQTFTFDALDNITQLQTAFPDGSNTTTFTYSTIDPTQLIGVRHSHGDYPPAVSLQYDANGQMTRDDQGRSLSYDPLGRLTQIATAAGSVIRGYHYDAQDRLIELSQPSGSPAWRSYHGGRVMNEVSGDELRTCWRQGGFVLGEHQPGVGNQLFGTDQQQSVLALVSAGKASDIAYSPYGYRPAEGGMFSLTGFNGEQLDPRTGLYLLGNGYRAYSPTLMRFLSPDSMSPFGAGGLNPYVYCLGDPVNRVDPTGHVSWQSAMGIGLSAFSIAASILTFGAATPLAIASLTLAVASGVAGIASAIAQEVAPQSELGDMLGYVSLGLGLASFSAGLGATAQGAGKVANAFKPGLSGDPQRAATAMASAMGRTAARDGSSTVKWTYTTPRKLPGFERLEGSSLDRFFKFKNAIRDFGMAPEDAAMLLGKNTKFRQITAFDSNSASETGMTEIKLNIGLRLFFLVNRDTRVVTLHKIGHTVKGS
jgi:RHS repeat-associated protein